MKDYDVLIKQKQSAIQKEKEELKKTKEELKQEKSQRSATQTARGAEHEEREDEAKKGSETTENDVRCFICGGAHYAKSCPMKKDKAEEKESEAQNDESSSSILNFFFLCYPFLLLFHKFHFRLISFFIFYFLFHFAHFHSFVPISHVSLLFQNNIQSHASLLTYIAESTD